ncbi:MAG TPA: ATP-binding protein [Eubacterium sp.]|nr:ATP-binding protein [Eubacterium sp.]HBZ52714.1 ATP-binding protein [Eubacterium sp.]
MRTILNQLKRYKKESVLGPLFKLLEASFELCVPLIVAMMIDKGVAEDDKSYVVKLTLVLVGFGLVGLLSAVTAQYFAAKAAVSIAADMRRDMFTFLQRLDYTQIDKLGTSTMITRMTSDIDQVQTGINLTLRLLLRSPFVVFGAMIMAMTIDLKSSLVFVGVIAVLSVIVVSITLITMPMYKKVSAKLDVVLRRCRENISGIRVIRAFGRVDREREAYLEENDSLTQGRLFAGRISACMNPLTYAVINLFTVLLIYVGALRVDSGILTQGKVVALYNYMGQILVELVKLANLCVNITKALASNDRIQKVYREGIACEGIEAVEPAAAVDVPYVLELDDVSCRYEGSPEDSVSSVSVKAKAGETIGIIGGTGSGKTTLVNLIPGFYPCSTGTVKVCGRDISKEDIRTIRELVAVVPQKAVLFKGTIRENLLWGNEGATDEELYEALSLSCAKEIVDSKEGGLDYMVEQGGRNFSGGQRQRLTIARALVKKGRILILDDSSSALDYITDKTLRHNLSELSYKPVKVIVSQRSASVMEADQIIVLEDGEVAGIGRHEELLENCPVYSQIHYSQYSADMKKGGAAL